MISVIIRAYNEGKYIGKCLAAVRAQVIDDDIEVVVVDSGSTDDTLEIARKYADKIVRIEKSQFTFGRSLNFGCEASSGDYLAFISAHCIPVDKSWLERLTAGVLPVATALAYGRQIGNDVTKFSEHQVFAKYFPKDNENEQGGFFCNNANSVIRKELWLRHWFNEELTGLEDMDWAKFFSNEGFEIQYVPEAGVYHIHEETWPKVKIRYEREAYALKEIMPEIHFNLRDFFWSFFRGVINDTSQSIKSKRFPTKLFEIVMFRFCQFYGTYIGNKTHRKLSKEKKTKYFYP